MFKNKINRTFIETLKSIKYGSLNLTDYDGRVYTFKGKNVTEHMGRSISFLTMTFFIGLATLSAVLAVLT